MGFQDKRILYYQGSLRIVDGIWKPTYKPNMAETMEDQTLAQNMYIQLACYEKTRINMR